MSRLKSYQTFSGKEAMGPNEREVQIWFESDPWIAT